MAGTVSPNGAVKVSIRLGDKGADGTGHLSGNTGAGTWRGAGGNSDLRRPLGSRDDARKQSAARVSRRRFDAIER